MDQLEADMTDMRVTGSQRRTGHNGARFTSTRFSQQTMDNKVGSRERLFSCVSALELSNATQ